MKRNKTSYWLLAIGVLLLSSCSMTKNIPEDDQLFTGLTKITYENYEKNDNFVQTQEEVEACHSSQWFYLWQQLPSDAFLFRFVCMERIRP